MRRRDAWIERGEKPAPVLAQNPIARWIFPAMHAPDSDDLGREIAAALPSARC